MCERRGGAILEGSFHRILARWGKLSFWGLWPDAFKSKKGSRYFHLRFFTLLWLRSFHEIWKHQVTTRFFARSILRSKRKDRTKNKNFERGTPLELWERRAFTYDLKNLFRKQHLLTSYWNLLLYWWKRDLLVQAWIVFAVSCLAALLVQVIVLK